MFDKRGDVACVPRVQRQARRAISLLGGSKQIAPPCPFCDSADTVVIGHDGAHGAITLCRCNACRTSGPKQFQTNPIRWSRHRVPLS